MVGIEITQRLGKCFPGSFINNSLEFIASKKGEAWFRLDNCYNELDVVCKVLEYLSRAASKGEPYATARRNREYNQQMLDGINRFLNTEFTPYDIEVVYAYLGNGCNREKTLRFIASGYNVNMLEQP